MKTIQKIALLITAFPVLAFAEGSSFSLGKMRKASLPKGSVKSFGTNSGGGGGGVCNTSKCQTLAQAGFRLQLKIASEFELEPDVIEEIIKIVNVLPLNAADEKRNSIAAGMIRSRGELKLSSDQDSRAFRKYKKQYFQLLQDSGAKISEDEFQLLAATDSEYTYIFPGYFKLDTRGKALLMIHEYNIKRKISLEKTLAFDGLVQDYLLKRENNTLASFDMWSFSELVIDLKLDNASARTKVNHLIDLVDKMGGKVLITDLCADTFFHTRTRQYCRIGRIQALRFRSYYPKFAEKYSDFSAEVSVETVSILNSEIPPEVRKGYEWTIETCRKDPYADKYIFAQDLNGDGHRGLVMLKCRL